MTKPALSQNETDPRLLHLAAPDNICVAKARIAAGEPLRFRGQAFAALEEIPLGHKVAVHALAPGDKVLKCSVPIGSATTAIRAGEYVHLHNLQSDYLPTYTQDAAFVAASEGGQR